MDMLRLLVGLVPCYPVCRSSLSYDRPPRFPFESSCCPPSPHSLGRVSFHSCCCPASPHSLGHHRRWMRGAAYPAVPSSSCHLTMQRWAASRTPWHRFPACFSAVQPSAASTQTPRGNDPSVARNSHRSSTMHLCQVSNCPPRQGPDQPSCRTLPDWIIAPCFAVPRPPKKRAAVFVWSKLSQNV